MTHVHLIGIGGTGLSAIARVLLESGYVVTGSDRALSPLALSLRSAGIRVDLGHREENILGADLVVRSSAVVDDNPEVQAAMRAGIPVLKRAEFLGRLTDGKRTLAVAGTHGKTTTTAMLAWILTALGRDPSFIIGGVSKNLHENAHAGKGNEFAIEADEYDGMFLGLHPYLALVTNVEHDHPDCYPTPEDYRQAFYAFSSRIDLDGALIACLDNPGAADLLEHARSAGQRTYAYSLHSSACDYQAVDLAQNERGGFSFRVVRPSKSEPATCLAEVMLQVPGEHNVSNATAALAAADQLGLDLAAAADALCRYLGAGRRFESIGAAQGVSIFSDYAHHPTEIRATLAAARARFPGRRIFAVWQPHTYSRTRALFADFAASFGQADRVIVTGIYPSREPVQDFPLDELVQAMRHPDAVMIPELGTVVARLLTEVRSGDVVIVLSAGDADRICTDLLARLQEKEAAHE
jgi:UDP-N-acetylmuramate--alanine ligase